MNTPAISGPANILPPAPASGNSALSADAAEAPFKQLLQREVTERRGADQAAGPESNQSAEKSPVRDSAAQAANGKSDTVAEKDTDETEASEETEQLSDAASASAELLALVASMAQIHSSPDAKTASVEGSAANLDPATIGKDKLLALNADDRAATAAPTDGLQGKDALLNARPDLAQNGKDMAKGPANAAEVQQLSTTQPAASPSGAIPIASLAAEPAGLAPEAGTATQASMLAPMQALNKVHAATMHAAETLAPPVGTPAWDQAVGQKVVWMVAGAQQSASLTLNPPDLGPMQIVLNVNNAQANATFVAAQPEVRQALEAALPRLREMLGEAGIQLGQANINAGTPQQGQGFDREGKPASSPLAQGAGNEQPLAPVRHPAIRQGLGMVDTFA